MKKLLFVLLIGFLPVQAPLVNLLQKPHWPLSIEERIVKESLMAGISAELPIRVAWRESKMNPSVISEKNRDGTRDWGLFGLNDTTLRTLRVAHPLNPAQNTIAGVGLIALYLETYRSERVAMCVYASGPGACGNHVRGGKNVK